MKTCLSIEHVYFIYHRYLCIYILITYSYIYIYYI